ncbi:glycoside hydrolase family 57 [Thiobaca trueperi]|uniref:Glycosyl hydrolase family 57 n=1 Tax=Thiobaca trueperi TaxID=127458 RepID=A0A4R3MY90_9GAMM|nr:glycoside hydrolase family 57 [Thiobaca trueperi]TCT21335.1 glycosyl hydrolase family 57 [Thiobaca trueperi]
MTETTIHHALGLHMHQPPGNLRLLIDANPEEAEAIMRCYERPARYALLYRDVARLHVGFSGVLLEQFLDPEVIDRYRHIIDIPAMLNQYCEADNIELVGMGYYHPIFPLIPRADWPEQLERGRAIMERVFGRAPRGFWPPEMAFSMEMIPALIQTGYEYAVVDGVHVRPQDGISDIFRPYVVCRDGVCLNVVPRDRELSSAQQSGLHPDWFRNEVCARAAASPRPYEDRLVTTWTDGENGGWFRQMHEPSGFFGHFFAPCMEQVRAGDSPVRPVCLSQYLAQVRPQAQAQVQSGAWNVGSNSGEELSQWTGSAHQNEALAAVQRLSERYWELCRCQSDVYGLASAAMFRARRLILEAETSCFLFWGEAWMPYLQARTGSAETALSEVEDALKEQSDSATAGTGAPPADVTIAAPFDAPHD